MITIEETKVERRGEHIFLSSNFDVDGVSQSLWYKFPLNFEKFIVTERLDTFTIALLFLGLKTGNDIKVNGVLSARLEYTLNHYLIPALCLANSDLKKIRVIAREVNSLDLNFGEIAGTGMSCGVDSLATYYDHINEKGCYKIRYFTFFNVGSHGDFGGDKARSKYLSRLNSIKNFVNLTNVELITVDSNISEILKMNFQQTNTLRNVSVILALQKLFRNYYLASKNRFDYFKLHKLDTQDYDSLILSFLSTESTTFYSAVQNYNRVERTQLISNFEATYMSLDVCTNLAGGNELKNCTRCKKCLRTALTLDLLGQLNKYKEVFDLVIYRKLKYDYIGEIIATKNTNQINNDIFKLLEISNDQKSYNFYMYKFKINTWTTQIKKKIKLKLKQHKLFQYS